MKMFLTMSKCCLQVFLSKKRYVILYTEFMFVEKLSHFVKKSIFKKFLWKLTQKCVFSVNNRLKNQIVGIPMGGPIFVVFFQIFISLKWKKTALLQ